MSERNRSDILTYKKKEIKMKSTIVCLKVLLLLSTVMLTACQTDDLPPIPQQAQTGRIVLSLSEVQLYTEGSTRAEQNGNIADYIYTLTNTATSEASTITFDNGSAIVPAPLRDGVISFVHGRPSFDL